MEMSELGMSMKYCHENGNDFTIIRQTAFSHISCSFLAMY